jgi:hypothetical protein
VADAVRRTGLPEDQLLYGAVVSIGCDAPVDVRVLAGESGLRITADKPASPTKECFAPMTTVALVLVSAAVVR